VENIHHLLVEACSDAKFGFQLLFQIINSGVALEIVYLVQFVMALQIFHKHFWEQSKMQQNRLEFYLKLDEKHFDRTCFRDLDHLLVDTELHPERIPKMVSVFIECYWSVFNVLVFGIHILKLLHEWQVFALWLLHNLPQQLHKCNNNVLM